MERILGVGILRATAINVTAAGGSLMVSVWMCGNVNSAPPPRTEAFEEFKRTAGQVINQTLTNNKGI